jgi:hypothetical protein
MLLAFGFAIRRPDSVLGCPLLRKVTLGPIHAGRMGLLLILFTALKLFSLGVSSSNENEEFTDAYRVQEI